MASDQDEGETGIDGEIDNTGFGDVRLGDRLRKLMRSLDTATGQPLPLACEDWANTKAAYRFLSNSSVSEERILAGHFRATARRAASCEGTLLVLGWRIFWLTMLNRARPNESPGAALTASEIAIIDRIAARAGRMPATAGPLSSYRTEIARLGGYLGRRHDPPPGNMIMWRGWSRLMDIQLDAELAAETLVGN
jgi:hypothetical protein